MIETGTARAGMSVERHFCRKTYTTIVTRTIAMSERESRLRGSTP